MLPSKAINKVVPKDDAKLVIEFWDGSIKEVDMAPLISEGGVFEQLKNPEIFKKVQIVAGGIIWNEDLDISQEYLYEHGENVVV